MKSGRFICEKEIVNTSKIKKGINQLGYAALFYMANFENKTIQSAAEISVDCCAFIKHNFKCTDNWMDSFDFNSRSSRRFKEEIKQFLNLDKVTITKEDFINWLAGSVLNNTISDDVVDYKIDEFYKKHGLKPYTLKQKERYIKTAKHISEKIFLENVLASINQDISKKIELLFNDWNLLLEFKKNLKGLGIKNVETVLKRFHDLKSFVNISLLNVPRRFLNLYYEKVKNLSKSHLISYSKNKRIAYLSIFLHIKHQEVIDHLVDLFLKMVQKIKTSSVFFVNKNILKDVTRVNGKYDIFHSLVDICLENPRSTIEDKIYPVIDKELLHSLKLDFATRGKWYQQQVFTKMRSLYVHSSRKPILEILKALNLKAENKSKDHLLKALLPILKKEPYTVDETFLKDWLHVIKDEKGEVDLIRYELIILSKLKDCLSHKSIFVEYAYSYRDNDLDLPKDFDHKKESYYQELGLPLNPQDFITDIKEKLKVALSDLNETIQDNERVKILKNGHIRIFPTSPQKSPLHLDIVQQAVCQKYAPINFLDILSETNFYVHFLDDFQSINEFDRMDKKDLHERLILCLYAIGSNTGLKKISKANRQHTYDDLKYVLKRYLSLPNVRSATVKVINYILSIRDPKIWGKASTSVSCDSTMVSVWRQNLKSQWQPKYREEGVMIYWHVDSKSLCIYAHPKVCSSSEVSSMIKGILNHDSRMNIDKAYVDTHGQSLIGFTIANMLGFNLLPRIKGIHRQKLASLEFSDLDTYQNIASIIGEPIQFQHITENYDMIVKYLCALKYGTIEPEVFIKRFSQNNYQNPTYKALNEIGKIYKTIFVASYLQNEALRIEINENLNIVERINSIMGFIFFGKLGEISSNDPHDHELSVACLHLLQASMVFINTILIQKMLSDRRFFNILEAEDLRALTPIIYEHINPYGIFVLDLKKRILHQSKQSKVKK